MWDLGAEKRGKVRIREFSCHRSYIRSSGLRELENEKGSQQHLCVRQKNRKQEKTDKSSLSSRGVYVGVCGCIGMCEVRVGSLKQRMGRILNRDWFTVRTAKCHIE